jgi:hypothetical protein
VFTKNGLDSGHPVRSEAVVADPILTVPVGSEDYHRRILTGNEYISVPEIIPETGGIASLNVLHMASCGLLEFCGGKGKPLVEPFLRVNGQECELKGRLRWYYRNHWEPGFYGQGKQWKLQGRIFAPPGHRGGIYVLSLKNTGTGSLEIDIGWRGIWGSINRTVFKRKPLGEKRRLFFDRWTGSLILEADSGIPLAAPHLEGLFHRNLFFNYFYALGRTLDAEQWAPVTSRSPHYYVSAAFWSRDALLWSFPALLLVEKSTAREVLLVVFKRHLERAGEHSHYLNGILLYPGFELDQLCAYFLALKHYLEFGSDFSILLEEPIRHGLGLLVQKLLSRKDPRTGLYSTFLDPSDDPVCYPFLIYDNALTWCVLQFLASLQERDLLEVKIGDGTEEPNFREMAQQLRAAIYEHGLVSGPNGLMFAWAVNGCGDFQLYDNPPGSLQLLAYYGFCSREDEIYVHTVNWIRSGQNPFFHVKGPLVEAGSLHAANPWPLAAANDLLALNRGGADFLGKVSMDNGFACETVHPEKGFATTGQAFASAAGFLAHAIWWRYKREGG